MRAKTKYAVAAFMGLALIALGLFVYWPLRTQHAALPAERASGQTPEPTGRKQVGWPKTPSARTAPRPSAPADVVAGPAVEAEAPSSEEEKREADEEKLVDAFDALTDKWMESEQKKPVTLADVRAFSDQFRQVPKDRREECLHRALNLIPDENVMLLAGILMDKTYDKETLELVYNDILNRDEAVKKPILQEVFKDKTHPCWADTAWILDVTGELPKTK